MSRPSTRMGTTESPWGSVISSATLRGVTTSDSSDQGLIGPVWLMHLNRILKTYDFPFSMFWTTGKNPAVNPVEGCDLYCILWIVPEWLPFKPLGVVPAVRDNLLVTYFNRAEAGERLITESNGDPAVSRPDTGPQRCRDGADRRLVAQVDRGRFNERPVGSVRSGEVRSYPETGEIFPIKSGDGDPPVTAPCCPGIRLRTRGRRRVAVRTRTCAAEIIPNREPRSAGPGRVEPRQVDFSVAAADMANSLDPEAGRCRGVLRVGGYSPRQ